MRVLSRGRMDALMLGLPCVVLAVYIGGGGWVPGTPAAAWRSRIEHLEATIALLESHSKRNARGVRGPVARARAPGDGPGALAGGDGVDGRRGAIQDDAVAVAGRGARGVGTARLEWQSDASAVVGGGRAVACGQPTLVVGVLTKADARGAELRTVLRETWIRLADPSRVTVRFLLSVKPGTSPPADVAREASEHGDILLLPVDPGSRKGYSDGQPSNLLERIQAFMRWVDASCGGYRYVLKTDDDCYVAVDAVLRRIDSGDFPAERLYMGRFLGGMPARDNKGKPDTDNYQNMHEFPKYAGAGYLLSPDVVRFIGRPGLPMLYHRVEDRGVGVMLFGFNVTYLDGEKEFQPWGACHDNSLWIHHFQKDTALMRRRYARAAAGKSICGNGFPANVVCAMADQGKPLVLKCPSDGQTIGEVVFASYGRHKTSAPGPCAEGMDALTKDATCHHEGSNDLVAKACLGKSNCDSLVNTVKALGVDPCPSEHWDKRFLAVVRCK